MVYLGDGRVKSKKKMTVILSVNWIQKLTNRINHKTGRSEMLNTCQEIT